MGNFYTDTILKDPRYRLATRCADPTLLEPVTRAVCLAILEQLGPGWMLWETMRSPSRQRELYKAGTTDLQNLGVHAFGLAFDIIRNDTPGKKKPTPSWLGDFSPLIQLALPMGMVCGLKRKNGTIDYPHVQRIRVRDQRELFTGAWYPDPGYTAKQGV